MQIKYTSTNQITLVYSKILIFDQIMAQIKIRLGCPYLGIRILAITQPFRADRAEIFYGNSGLLFID